MFKKRTESESSASAADPVVQFDPIIPKGEEVKGKDKSMAHEENKQKVVTKRDSKSADARKLKKSKTLIELGQKSSKSSIKSLDLENARKMHVTAQPLFDAAQMVCNIVDVTQDSTLNCRGPKRSLSADTDSPNETPKDSRKLVKIKSMSSATPKSGPFSTIKENEKKAKKKDSALDLSELGQELNDD